MSIDNDSVLLGAPIPKAAPIHLYVTYSHNVAGMYLGKEAFDVVVNDGPISDIVRVRALEKLAYNDLNSRYENKRCCTIVILGWRRYDDPA
jgi:hypothetical protein